MRLLLLQIIKNRINHSPEKVLHPALEQPATAAWGTRTVEELVSEAVFQGPTKRRRLFRIRADQKTRGQYQTPHHMALTALKPGAATLKEGGCYE